MMYVPLLAYVVGLGVLLSSFAYLVISRRDVRSCLIKRGTTTLAMCFAFDEFNVKCVLRWCM